MTLRLRAYLDSRFGPARANFLCHLVEGIFASFSGHVVGGLVLQLLLTKMGYSASALGFLGSLGLATSVLQFLVAREVEAVRRKKRLVLLLGIGQRLPLLTTALGVFFFGSARPHWGLVIIAAGQVIGGLSVCVLVAPWMDLVAETVPPEWTGRLFGLRNSIASALGMAAAGVNAAIIARIAFPGNFALIYAIGFGSMVMSWLIFAIVDESPTGAARPKVPRRHYYRELLAVLRDDANYRWFLLYSLLLRLGTSVGAFYAMYAAQYYGVSAAFAVGGFTMATQAATIAGHLGFGAIVDTLGPKRMMEMGLVMLAGATLAMTAVTSRYGFAAAIFVSALGHGAMAVSNLPFTMRLFPRGRRVGYSALTAIALLPISVIASSGTGVLLDKMHCVVFLGGGILTLAAILPLEHCHLRPQGEQHQNGAGGENS